MVSYRKPREGRRPTVAAVSLALQIVVTGLAAGGVYGLIAVGHSLVYRLTGIVHLAYGDLIGLGVFTTLLVAAGTGPVTQETAGGPRFLVALLAGLLVCVAAGSGSYVFPDPIPFRDIGRSGFVTVGGASLQVRSFFVIAAAVGLALLAGLTLDRTRFGRGLQAIAADSEGARIVGVPVDTFVALAFGLAGGLAALAAVIAAPSGSVTVETGALLGLKGLVAALAVRFGSPLSAMVAGLALGLGEATIANAHVGSLELGPSYRTVLPLALVLLFVALRPQLEAVETEE